MKQDMILILDLGSEQNTLIAREIRELGVYTEIHPHDLTAEELAALPNVKGIILNGGPNRVVDGAAIDAGDAVYQSGLPLLTVDHESRGPAGLTRWPRIPRPGGEFWSTLRSRFARRNGTGTWKTSLPTR